MSHQEVLSTASGVPLFHPLAALVLFALWTMTLVLALGAWRLLLVVTRRVPSGGFTPGTQHGSDAYWRLNRAHMNATENLPIFATLVLVAAYFQVPDPAFEWLTSLVLYARIAQSLIHVSSGSQAAIALRFLAFVVQVVAMIGIAAMDLKAAGAPMPW